MNGRPVGWLLPALGLAGWISAASGQGTSESIAQAPNLLLERVNHYRSMAGSQPVAKDPHVEAAAQSHAQYMADVGQLSHAQTDRTSPHYSGDTLEERLRKAGAKFAHSGEVVGLASQASPVTVVDDLMSTVYHRLLLLSHGFAQAGAGVARGAESGLDAVYVTIDFAGARTAAPGAAAATVYPIDSQDQVGLDFDPASETPNPVPERELVGQPITIQVAVDRRLVVERFTLTVEGQAQPVEARVLTQSEDMQMPEWAAALVPLQPLAPATRYHADFAGSVAGAPIERTWRFTTVASRAVLMSFAQAVVEAGGTQTVRLRNVDRNAGSYYICYEPTELIRSTAQESFSQFSMTVSRCAPGASCVVTVLAAYDEGCRNPIARGSFRVGG